MDITRTDGMARQASDLVKQAYARGFKDGLKAAAEKEEPVRRPAMVVIEMSRDEFVPEEVGREIEKILDNIREKERVSDGR